MTNNESILLSVKDALGIETGVEVWDPELIMFINAVFVTLHQIGVGPDEPYSITGSSETWADFGGDEAGLGAIQAYTYLKVRLLFDPPTTTTMFNALSDVAKEYEWRLNVHKEGET